MALDASTAGMKSLAMSMRMASCWLFHSLVYLRDPKGIFMCVRILIHWVDFG